MKKEMLNSIRETLAEEAERILTEVNDRATELVNDEEWLEKEVYNNPECGCEPREWAWATAGEEIFGPYVGDASDVMLKVNEICHIDADDEELESLVYERGGNYYVDIWYNRNNGYQVWVA